MKAFLLAAGLGTRLRPLTDRVPKCLVPIAGVPLLGYWLALFERHGVDEVLINVHHLPDPVRQFVAAQRGGPRVTVFHEPELLGSAGTIRANASWIDPIEPFLVAYADNLTGSDLSRLVATHRAERPVLTMGLFRAAEPQRCGIAEVAGGGERGAIVGFVEKPQVPASNLANAGIYVTDARILDWIPETMPADLGHDVLPRLAGRMFGELLSAPLIDVGTWESYERAQREVGSMGLTDLVASGKVRE